MYFLRLSKSSEHNRDGRLWNPGCWCFWIPEIRWRTELSIIEILGSWLLFDCSNPFTSLASSLCADLRDLPPLIILVGLDALLLSDSIDLSDRAQASGVDVPLDVWEKMQHEWHFAAVSFLRAISRLRGLANLSRVVRWNWESSMASLLGPPHVERCMLSLRMWY